MASHLLAISDKKWRYAFYVAPDRGEKARPEDYFRQHRQRDREKPACATGAKHRDVFRFYTLDELKNTELDNYA